MPYLYIAFLSLSLLLSTCSGDSDKITSPNKKIAIEYSAPNGLSVTYQARNGEVKMMEIPQYGVKLANSDNSFKLVSVSKAKRITDKYEMISGKRKNCYNQATERIFHFENSAKIKLDIIIRAYNDGIALRYHLPQVDMSVVIEDDATQFAFKDGIKRWTQEFTVGYEGFYRPNTDGKAGNRGMKWGFPALFQTSDDTYVLLTEANISRQNCGAYLLNKENPSLYDVNFTDPEVVCQSGWSSPWRIAIMGELGDIVESTLVTDVSEPNKLKDVEWVEPGVVSWIYWAYNHGSRDYQIVKKYIDFAAEMNLPYVLIDWEWDSMGNGGQLKDALSYCKEKGIKPLLWYNSSTAWCGPGPLYRLNTPEARAKEFKWLQEMGVKGIKIDFFPDDNLSTMNYYIDLLEDAAKHQIMINFHGATLPRGWRRTYPNLMTIEGVYGAEWYNNNGTLTPNAAWHNCTLPFTRNVVGPMDYTPCAFTDSQHPHITSDAHELALLVVFESSLQHLADRPEGFLAQPKQVQNLISELPTAWDDTKFIAGYPSESIIMARKRENSWYIAGLNGTNEEKTLTVDLSLIGEKISEITLYKDNLADKKEMQIETISAKENSLEINTLPRGGFVIEARVK